MTMFRAILSLACLLYLQALPAINVPPAQPWECLAPTLSNSMTVPVPLPLTVPLLFPPATFPEFAVAHHCSVHSISDTSCLTVSTSLLNYIARHAINTTILSDPVNLCPMLGLPAPLYADFTTSITSPLHNSRHAHTSHLSIPLRIAPPIPLTANTTTILPTSNELQVAYKMDDITAQAFTATNTLHMDFLTLGRHTITLQLFSHATNLPLTPPMTSHFSVGEVTRIVDCVDYLCTGHESTDSWYSVYPQHLSLRNVQPAAQEDGGTGDTASFEGRTKAEPTSCSSRDYLLYRSPIHGLNNQKYDLLGALAVAITVQRTLVLPYLFSDLLTGSDPTVVSFGDVFDVEWLKDKLLGVGGCFVTFEEFGVLEPAFDEVDVVMLEHGSIETLPYYTALFSEVEERFVMLDRPRKVMAQFPVNVNELKGVVDGQLLRGALRPNAKLRGIGDMLIEGMGGSAPFVSVHARVEEDWIAYCQVRERTHWGMVRVCYDGQIVGEKVGRFVEKTGVTNVYVAVGENVGEQILEQIVGGIRQFDASVRVFTKKDLSDLLPSRGAVAAQAVAAQMSTLTHIEMAMVDYYVCVQGKYFVGTSFSTFSNEVSREVEEEGRQSYVYNVKEDLDGMGVVRRRDEGRLVEPYDVVGYGERARGVLKTVLERHTSAAHTSANVTVMSNPYPIVRADVSVGERGGTFVVFEGEDVGAVASEFCAAMVEDTGDRRACGGDLVALTTARKKQGVVDAAFEKKHRICEMRFQEGIDLYRVAAEIVDEGPVYNDFGRVMEDLVGSVLPEMEALGWEVGTDKVTHHGYHRFYSKYFSLEARTKPLTLLEIGLAKGSSMNLWCGLLPTAVIVGVDITLHPDCQPCSLGAGIYVYSGDSSDSALLQRLSVNQDGAAEDGAASSGYDYIVDDGAHTPSSQLKAFNHLFEHGLNEGGVYFIEDIETSYWTKGELYGYKYKGGGVNSNTAENVIDVFKGLADAVNAEFFNPYNIQLPGLRSEVVAMVEGIEFGHNCVAITKKSRQKNSIYYDRSYRMRDNVDGYPKVDVEVN